MRCVVREYCRDRNTFADRVFCSEDTFAIADGMGIGEGAVRASQKAVDLVGKYRPFTSQEDVERFFNRANVKIMEETARLGDRHITGTTLSLISFVEDHYVVGHVGDSRIYLYRDGSLDLLTEDQIEIKNGKKYVSVLGIDWKLSVLTRQDSFYKGDVFLLISDGAVESLDNEDIKKAMDTDLDLGADKLLDLCVSTNPKDDISFVMVLVD